jgi:hypothetical protein
MSTEEATKMNCPVHGLVEGYFETEGALGNAYPYPVLCEKCPPGKTIIGYENEKEEVVDQFGETSDAH